VPLNSSIPANKVPALVAAHVRLQIGCYFTAVNTTTFGDVATSRHITDHYWNSLSGFPNADLASLEAGAAPFFHSKQRNLAFYLDPTTASKRLLTELESASYEIEPEIWLGIDRALNEPGAPGAVLIEAVTQDSLPDFLRVFSQAFGGPATEKDGYGDIPPAYLAALEDSYSGTQTLPGVTQRHFVAYVESIPIACASVHYDETFGGLYNVGTIPSHRGKGIGTALSLHALNHAITAGVRRVFLQTQPNGSVQRLYEKLGCAKLFEAAIAYKQ
jgi:ribosomal protein S18 acetylase RimI-like enzyme